MACVNLRPLNEAVAAAVPSSMCMAHKRQWGAHCDATERIQHQTCLTFLPCASPPSSNAEEVTHLCISGLFPHHATDVDMRQCQVCS